MKQVCPVVAGTDILLSVVRLLQAPGHLRNAEIVVAVLQRPAYRSSHGAEALVVKILN